MTEFAPPDRASRDTIEQDHALLATQAPLIGFLKSICSLVLVLNPQRQIVFASDDYLRLRGLNCAAEVLGLRPGEAMHCIHSNDQPAGCGTSESCSVCGAVRAILESFTRHERVTHECRMSINVADGIGTLDWEVTATPWSLENRNFTVLTVRDIGPEKRQKSLERIFFHDIVNTAGGLAGLLELLADYPDLNEGKELVDMSQRCSRDILEEIQSFRQLKMAESGELVTNFTTIDPEHIVLEVTQKIRFHPVAEGKSIELENPSACAAIRSDRLLLERVLVNMLKNALEATPVGGEVTLGYRPHAEGIQFFVRNHGMMPRDVQLQIFQRSFSTKSADRGLGTYSMRLLGETYLRGQVAFTSGPVHTEFTLSLPN